MDLAVSILRALEKLRREEGGKQWGTIMGMPKFGTIGERGRLGHGGPAATIEILRGLGFRQTIHAAEVAADRDADAQVAENAAVGIE